ncbi:MAG: hypothetical protein IJP92_05835 [Lachnospiraceae bacterium]|nr:hypothetical protein [Lachnospiraceae bacterium]
MIKQLEYDLKEYEKVYLVTSEFSGGGDLADHVLHVAEEGVTASETGGRILVLFSVGTEGNSSPTVSFRKITAEEEKDLILLYYTYEFSDRFRLITDTDAYGTLWNYVQTGVLTREEALYAMITKT